MDGRTDRWTDECMDMDGRTDGKTDRWMNGRMNKFMIES